MCTKKMAVAFFLILPLLMLSGCAKKYWTETLEEEESVEITRIVHEMQEADNSCPQNLETDIKAFVKTPGENFGVQGYLQLLSPSYLKFVLSNPLGQPMYILASNGSMFQSLDMNICRHIRGSVRSLGIRNNIPLIIMHGDWYAFFTGRLPAKPLDLKEIYRNEDDGSIWLSLPGTVALTGKLHYTYISIDPVNRRVLTYLFLDDRGKTLAEISYSNPENPQDHCEIRQQMYITELPWDSSINLEMDKIETDMRLQKKDFILPVPKNYSKQLHP